LVKREYTFEFDLRLDYSHASQVSRRRL